MDVAGEFSIRAILAVLGLVLNWGVGRVRRRVLFWDPSQKLGANAPLKKGGV
jgi:ABC-type nitrate/sulfonate/bicarbonate transport system permease component